MATVASNGVATLTSRVVVDGSRAGVAVVVCVTAIGTHVRLINSVDAATCARAGLLIILVAGIAPSNGLVGVLRVVYTAATSTVGRA